ncbi:MAG: hypothetical protein A2V66_13585 [Ignavibacteria bacterium RBG_13_36_8]|nr:MAG: hypothetical protein A2V66_13585 [Ignavibacteria bacterium RBG_13_36_8]
MRKFFFLYLVFPAFILAQELDATIIINYEQLPTAAKERLEGFQRAVEDYLNNNRFTRSTWDGEKIKCAFNIFFTGSSGETNYTAQAVVTSQRPIYQSTMSSLMMRTQDQSWSFKYEKGQSMYFNQTDFDPLTSFLDFYAYIIIGFDSDSFSELGGSDYFSKAFDIVVLGASSKFQEGWASSSSTYNRRGLVDDLLNTKFQQFRQDYFNYHYNGIDLITEDIEAAWEEMIVLIRNLEKIKDKIDARSVLLKLFFDAKNGEICDYLRDYPDRSIFTALKKIDPAHIAKYDEVLSNESEQ